MQFRNIRFNKTSAGLKVDELPSILRVHEDATVSSHNWHTISAERNMAIRKRSWHKITDHPLIMTWVGLLAGFGLLELVLLPWRWFV